MSDKKVQKERSSEQLVTESRLEKHRSSRRKLLKTATVAGGVASAVPAGWTKPIIKKTMLPAHAETTCIGNINVTLGWDGVDCQNSFNSDFSGSVNCDFVNDGADLGDVTVSVDPPPGIEVALELTWSVDGAAFSSIVPGDTDFLDIEASSGSGDFVLNAAGDYSATNSVSLNDSTDCPNSGTLTFSISGSGYCPVDVTINFSENACT